MSINQNSIKVVCRFRPQNKIELKESGRTIANFDDDNQTVTIGVQQNDQEISDNNTFTFDRIFGPVASQQDIFNYSIKSTVDDVLNGYNGTVFAYGQTGSGKTFTMMGSEMENEELKGIIPRIIESIFGNILISPDIIEYTVNVSYMEIYMERIRDLLNPSSDNLPIHEEKSRGVYVKGLCEVYVSSIEEVYEVMRQGGSARAVGSTNMNAESSRSHSIFVITIAQRNLQDGGSQKTGRLYLVDLAGSEKVGKTGASGQTLEEAKKINKSLSSLGMVINALTDGKSSHVPYRDSKLTRILQESLGGNSRTTLIINCSPSDYNESETISTLRFGMRAKKIQNKAKINQDLSPAELKALLKKSNAQCLTYQQYILLLEDELKKWRSGDTVSSENYASMGKIKSALAAPVVSHYHSKSLPIIDPSTIATNVSTPYIPTPPLSQASTSRPWTPSIPLLTEDERDRFLEQENKLMDNLAEKEDELSQLQATLASMTLELNVFRSSSEGTLYEENKVLNEQLTNAKANYDSIKFENNELKINFDTLADSKQQLEKKLQEALERISELENDQQASADRQKERSKGKRVAKIAKMMAQSETATKVANHEVEIRDLLTNLEKMSGTAQLPPQQIEEMKQELLAYKVKVQANQQIVHQLNEDKEIMADRFNALQHRFTELEADHEKLLMNTLTQVSPESTDAMTLQVENRFRRELEVLQSELSSVQKSLNSKLEEVSTLNSQNQALIQERDVLNDRVDTLTAISKDTEGEVQRARLAEAMSQQLEKFERLKVEMASDLEARCERVAELEMTLEATQQEYQEALNLHESKHRISQKKKLDMLESHLEQLLTVHKELMEQNTKVKKEIAICERKLNTRNDRITSLEKLLEESQQKLKGQADRFELQIQQINGLNEQRQRLVKPPSLVHMDHSTPSQIPRYQSRIIKPIKGGNQSNANSSNIITSNPVRVLSPQQLNHTRSRTYGGLSKP